jgi:hypothetical protein
MYNNKIIFSVFRDEFADTNEKSHRSTILALNGLGIETTEVLGVYNGSSEKSIMVQLTDYNIENVLSITKLFKQESILISDDHKAYLLFLEGETLSLGGLQEVTEIEAKTNESYTYVPSTGVYLITK